jgi:predicted transcriptional regulator
MSKLWDVLFGCSHKRYTFPITVRHGQRRRLSRESVRGTYVVCLDCGKEFGYDWREMKVLFSPSETTPTVREAEVVKPAA